MRYLLVLILTLTLTGEVMGTQKKINWKSIMTSNEAYTYKPKVQTPVKKTKSSIWDDDYFNKNPMKKGYYRITFSKGGKV